jgi:hypothetical protein
MCLEEILAENGFKTNCAVGIQVGKFLDVEFLDGMMAVELLLVVD